MLIKINPITAKKVLIQLNNLIAVRVTEILTDHLNCEDYLRCMDSIECTLPQNISIEDIASFLSQYFGATQSRSSDEILIMRK